MTSLYQSVKLDVLEVLDLSKDAVHMHIGLGVFFVWVWFVGRGKVTLMSLLPVIFIAAGMEAIDLFDDYHAFGFLRWRASIHDLINTCFWPAIIVLGLSLKHRFLDTDSSSAN